MNQRRFWIGTTAFSTALALSGLALAPAQAQPTPNPADRPAPREPRDRADRPTPRPRHEGPGRKGPRDGGPRREPRGAGLSGLDGERPRDATPTEDALSRRLTLPQLVEARKAALERDNAVRAARERYDARMTQITGLSAEQLCALDDGPGRGGPRANRRGNDGPDAGGPRRGGPGRGRGGPERDDVRGRGPRDGTGPRDAAGPAPGELREAPPAPGGPQDRPLDGPTR